MSDKKAEVTVTTQYSKFTLIDLLSILLLVGLIFIFIVPVNQAKVSRDKINEAVTIMRMIGDNAIEFKNSPDKGDGDYPVDISQLNLGDKIKSKYFEFVISPDDSTVVAYTTLAYVPNRDSLTLVYNLSGKQFRIGKNDNDAESKKYINENWLP